MSRSLNTGVEDRADVAGASAHRFNLDAVFGEELRAMAAATRGMDRHPEDDI